MKQKVKLTESQLRNMIVESVKKVLKEINIVGKIENFDRNKSYAQVPPKRQTKKVPRNTPSSTSHPQHILDLMSRQGKLQTDIKDVITSKLPNEACSIFNELFTQAYMSGKTIRLQFEDADLNTDGWEDFDMKFRDIMVSINDNFSIIDIEEPSENDLGDIIAFITIANPLISR